MPHFPGCQPIEEHHSSRRVLQLHLTYIFAACLAYGYIPIAWRAVRVILIPKSGRDSYELAKSFRPISLTSFFFKTMEKLVDSYIRAGLLNSFPHMKS
jgi:hypothetical protein